MLAGGGSSEEMAADQAAISERCFCSLLTHEYLVASDHHHHVYDHEDPNDHHLGTGGWRQGWRQS